MKHSNSAHRWALGLGAVLALTSQPTYALKGSGDPPKVKDASDGLFVPIDFVPLSAFVEDDTGTVKLAVDPDLLSSIDDINESQNPLFQLTNPVKVAIWDESSVSIVTPVVNEQTGIVTLSHSFAGSRTFVVVCPFFKNHFMPGSDDPLGDKSAIVTHWDWSLNPVPGTVPNPPYQTRGGQFPGGNDAFLIRDWQEAEITECFSGDPVAKERMTPRVIRDLKNVSGGSAEPGNYFYYWASHESAVFSDGSGFQASATVPGTERFVGENYEPSGFTQLACIWLSDRVRQKTGFPVMHRNSPFAFQTNSPDAQQVMQDVPLFQVAHAWEVEYEDPNFVGREHSLATFLLPPGWVKDPGEAAYPVLFNGSYGVNPATFGAAGRRAFKVLGDLIGDDPSHLAVGVLWNGGGDGACQTVQETAYAGMERLMQDVVSELGADPHRILATGGSRGGSTALAFAGNPDSNFYTVPFVIANSAQTDMFDTLNYIDSTYDLVQEVCDTVTGYLGSWVPGWTNFGSAETAREVCMQHLFGTVDEDEIRRRSPVGLWEDEDSSNDEQLLELVDNSTSVVFRLGTHDHSRPFGQAPRYVERLGEFGVPYLAEYSYRFGHGFAVGTKPDEADLMKKLFGDPSGFVLGAEHENQTRYYRRDPNSACKDDPNIYYQAHEEFLLENDQKLTMPVPFVVEAPIDHYVGAESTIHIVGQEGLFYTVGVFQIDTDPWYMNVGLFGLSTPGDYIDFQTDYLPTSDMDNAYTSADYLLTDRIPSSLAGHKFLLFAGYQYVDGGVLYMPLEGTASRPFWDVPMEPTVKVTEPGLEFHDLGGVVKRGTNVKTVTGGLSEDSADYFEVVPDPE